MPRNAREIIIERCAETLAEPRLFSERHQKETDDPKSGGRTRLLGASIVTAASMLFSQASPHQLNAGGVGLIYDVLSSISHIVRRRSFMLRLSSAVVIFLLGIGFFPRLVLCVGVDGHRAIEPAIASCCGLAAHPDHADRWRGDACSPSCTDTLLTPAVAALRLDGAGLLALDWHVGAAPLCSLFDPCLQVSVRSTLGNDHGSASRSPRTLRTTVDLR